MRYVENNNPKIDIYEDKSNTALPSDLGSSIYKAIHLAIQSHDLASKYSEKTILARKNAESLLTRLSNRLMNPFGYDITIE